MILLLHAKFLKQSVIIAFLPVFTLLGKMMVLIIMYREHRSDNVGSITVLTVN